MHARRRRGFQHRPGDRRGPRQHKNQIAGVPLWIVRPKLLYSRDMQRRCGDGNHWRGKHTPLDTTTGAARSEARAATRSPRHARSDAAGSRAVAVSAAGLVASGFAEGVASRPVVVTQPATAYMPQPPLPASRRPDYVTSPIFTPPQFHPNPPIRVPAAAWHSLKLAQGRTGAVRSKQLGSSRLRKVHRPGIP